ncbi:MAG: hypothetical protein QXO30_02960 [Candidatus Caldarchaeum sp.]
MLEAWVSSRYTPQGCCVEAGGDADSYTEVLILAEPGLWTRN